MVNMSIFFYSKSIIKAQCESLYNFKSKFYLVYIMFRSNKRHILMTYMYQDDPDYYYAKLKLGIKFAFIQD